MGYVTDQKSQIHSEFGLIIPRLKAFALALTGSENQAQTLLRATHHHILARASKERGHTPLLIWALMQTQKIWCERMAGKSVEKADPRLFLPRSRENNHSPAAQFASQLAALKPIQRGVLHIVYGERLSYDEAAEIFDVEISDIITMLVRSYAALNSGQQSAGKRPSRPTKKTAMQERRGRAA